MTCFLMDIPLRGDRSYLQASDVLSALIESPNVLHGLNPSQVEIKFSRRLRKQPRITLLPDRRFPNDAAVTFTIKTERDDVFGFLQETDGAILGRISCKDHEIGKVTEINGDRAWVKRGKWGDLESIVAITKQLHHSLFAMDSKLGRWAVVRFQFSQWNNIMGENLLVTFDSQWGERFTKSHVETEKGPLGHIFFARANEAAYVPAP